MTVMSGGLNRSDSSGSTGEVHANRPVTSLSMLVALALSMGIVIGWRWPESLGRPVWPWLGFAAALLLVAAYVRRRRADVPAAAIALTLVAVTAIGAAWVTLKQHYSLPDDLAAMIGDDSTLVRLRGSALNSPVTRHRVGGALAKFDYRPPSTYFRLRVEAMMDHRGVESPARGEVLVRVDESVAPFRAGDTVQVTGFLLRPGPPRNPGEFDYRAYAQSLGQAGLLRVEQRDLLTVTPATRGSLYEWFLNWRDQLRRRAGGWLLSDLPQTSRTERDSLLGSLLLGLRDEQIDGVYGSFQRVGLAHVLAISGFHLGVLAGFVLLMARLISGQRAWHGWLVIAFVLLYLLLVETGMPVLRAGVMTILASLGLVYGRRLHVGGLVWTSAIVLLLWRPDQLFNGGFQLTFGVVLGLIHLAPPLRRRWFGRPNPEAPTIGAMAAQWLFTALASSMAAWLIALPIALFHFGFISPWGVILSVLTLPLAAVILAIGFLKMALAAILPSAAMLIGIPLSISTDILLAIVMTADALPGAVWHIANPSSTWALAATLWVCWLLRGDRWAMYGIGKTMRAMRLRRVDASQLTQLKPGNLRLRRRHPLSTVKWLTGAALVCWLLWPHGSNAALRIDMLAVGDGSCYLIRSGSSTVVFDAGSSSDLNVARRSLIPALRRMGVRHIDAIAISHADMDHYSAVVELSEEFSVEEVLVTPQILQAAQDDRSGPIAFMLERLNQARPALRTMVVGDHEQFGSAIWTWLSPSEERTYQRDNDASMVIRIECAGRSILMCGDIQRKTMNELLGEDALTIRADVLELPHHGSHHAVAEKFVRRVEPRVVMQSTGWTRWSRDKWAAALQGKERLVTARDGACWVEIGPDGAISTGRFIGNAEPQGSGVSPK